MNAPMPVIDNPVSRLLAALAEVNDMIEKETEIPDSIGRCADLYHDVREVRLAVDNGAEQIKSFETKLREHIIGNLSKSADTGAAGLRYRAQIVSKRLPKLTDWGVFTSWVRKNDRFDLLQKRLSEKAVMDTIETDGRVLPGLEIMQIPDVSITKI
jgi:hypothetical protein